MAAIVGAAGLVPTLAAVDAGKKVLLANKGYFRNIQDCETRDGRTSNPFKGIGNFGGTVSLLGAGAIGTLVIGLLQPFHLELVVFDPFLPDERAAELGDAKVAPLGAEAARARNSVEACSPSR